MMTDAEKRRLETASKEFRSIPFVFSECEDMDRWTLRDYVSEAQYQLDKHHSPYALPGLDYRKARETIAEAMEADPDDPYWRRKAEDAQSIIDDWKVGENGLRKFIKKYSEHVDGTKCFVHHCSKWDN